MKKQSLFLSLILFAGWIFLAPSALAQTGTPPAPNAWIGAITGTLVNQNEANKSPGAVELMLHAWDQNNSEKLMLQGQTETDGSFRFGEVPFEAGIFYSVMAIYEGASYFSEPVVPLQAQSEIEVEIPIFETKADLEGVQIDQMHILFYITQGGLGVTEVYVLSNMSDRTVREAVKLEELEGAATLKFSLSPGAANMAFNTQDQARFLIIPGGFVDTEPLVPGKGTGQIMVSYVLPYENAQTYTYTPPVPTVRVNLLLDATAGIKLEGDNLVSRGVQALQDGAEFAIFEHGSLLAGEIMQIQLSGEPQILASGTSGVMGESASANAPVNADATTSPADRSVALGGLVLGLALVGVGVWWFRKEKEDFEDEIPEARENSLDELIAEIAQLDRSHQEGALAEEEYQNRRGPLLEEAKSLLARETRTV